MKTFLSTCRLGSVMYFVVAMMADVDPMYQYSLKYFSQVPQEKPLHVRLSVLCKALICSSLSQLFNQCIENSEPSKDLQKRLEILLKNTTESVYTNVAR